MKGTETMAKVINVIGQGSNVGKTVLMEGLIKELRSRGLTVATVKHDVHGFDIDHPGKDTYRHRQAGANTVVISSKNRFAMIKEVEEEILKIHDYETCEIISYDITNGNEKFLKWIEEETK